jgi:hypothetical protein
MGEQAGEIGAIEWQVAEGSQTAHLIDTSKPGWRTANGERRLNGPRSACGKYPQRNAERPWFGFPVSQSEQYRAAVRHYRIRLCGDCLRASTPPGQSAAGTADQ